MIADADTGFGNELNVVRTVREYAAAGVAALHIEDQEFPKRCGHLDDKAVIAADRFVSRVRAAAENRPDDDLVLIARTDARAVHGFEEAIERANRALEAGADVAFVEAPRTLEEVAEVPRRVEGPCLLNVVAAGKTPDVGLERAAELGYRVAIVPVLLLAAVLAAGDAALAGLAGPAGTRQRAGDRPSRRSSRARAQAPGTTCAPATAWTDPSPGAPRRRRWPSAGSVAAAGRRCGPGPAHHEQAEDQPDHPDDHQDPADGLKVDPGDARGDRERQDGAHGDQEEAASDGHARDGPPRARRASSPGAGDSAQPPPYATTRSVSTPAAKPAATSSSPSSRWP